MKLNPRDDQCKYEPQIHHLDIGGTGQSRWYADEQGGQDQHDRFGEELLEEVGCLDDPEHQDSVQVSRENR